MEKIYVGDSDSVNSACGVGVFGSFHYYSQSNSWYNYSPSIQEVGNEGGAGWAVVGFVNTPLCKEAYRQLKQRFGRPVYQSPVRINNNSGNEFFFCVFDTKGK